VSGYFDLVRFQINDVAWHCVMQETDEIQFESYSRIEHVITGYWLHALRGETERFYLPNKFVITDVKVSMNAMAGCQMPGSESTLVALA